MTSPRAARLGLLQICLAAVLWGTGGLAVQLVRERAPLSVLTISAWRMVIAALALVALMAATRSLGRLRLGRRVVLVGLATGAYQALYFAAVVAAGVTVATVVSLGLAPVLLTVAESLHERRRPGRSRVVGLLTAMTGLVLVSTAAVHAGTGPHPWWGVLLALASGTAYAGATAASQRLTATAHPLALTTSVTIVGAVALAPLGLISARGDHLLLSTDPVVLGLLAFLGVATMALAYALFYSGLRVTRGSVATVASLLEPVTAAAAAVVVLGEPLLVRGMVGTGLIVAAIVVLA